MSYFWGYPMHILSHKKGTSFDNSHFNLEKPHIIKTSTKKKRQQKIDPNVDKGLRNGIEFFIDQHRFTYADEFTPKS